VQDYGSDAYWASRYAAGVEHEWYCPPKVLVQLLPSPPGHLNASERMAAEMAGRRPTRPTARALVLGATADPRSLSHTLAQCRSDPSARTPKSALEQKWHGYWACVAFVLGVCVRGTILRLALCLSPIRAGNCREELPKLLLEKGFAHVLSVDVVEAAMAELTARVTATNPALQFRVMDASDLRQLDDQWFDLVVDKGASLPSRSPENSCWGSLQRSGRGSPSPTHDTHRRRVHTEMERPADNEQWLAHTS
jgi:hypothetical protein